MISQGGGLQATHPEPDAPDYLTPPAFLHGLPAIVGETVHVGEFGGDHPPAVSIDAGDEVLTSTLGLWGGQATPDDTFDDILRKRTAFAGRGPHSLTGPIEVFDAKPGDAIGVEILRVRPSSHGVNLVTPYGVSRGVLTDRFRQGYVRHFDIDPDAGVARSNELTVPIDPFVGFVGVSPASDEAHSSIEPGSFGGNLDIAAATVGTTVWLPVQRDGGLVYVGDGHAAQGDGELNGTAIECGIDSLQIKLHLVPDAHLTAPRLTRDDALITVGLGQDLAQAVHAATADMVTWLESLGVSAESAYTLCSVAATLRVSQVVNRVVGVHLSLAREVIPVDTLTPIR